jgi:hypothetical protein
MRYSTLETLNAYRATLGLEAFKEHGGIIPPEECNWGAPYPIDALFPNFVSPLAGKGVQFDGPFATYGPVPVEDLPGAKMDDPKLYGKDFSWEELKGDANKEKYDGKRFVFKAGLGAFEQRWDLFEKGIDTRSYMAVQLRMPGKKGENLSEKISGYILDGTQAAVAYNACGIRGQRETSWEKGTRVAGTVYFTGYGSYPYAIVIEYLQPTK